MPSPHLDLAGADHYTLADARVPLCLAPGVDLPADAEGLARCDIEITGSQRDRIKLQAVAIFPVDMAVDDEAQFRALVATVGRYGGVLGGVTFRGHPPGDKLDLALDHIFAAAAANGFDLDFHVDESDSPQAKT